MGTTATGSILTVGRSAAPSASAEDRAMELLSLLKSKSTDELGEAMRLGPRESQTEFEYYQSGFDKAPHVPAIHLFSGDGMKANKAYRGLR